MGGVSPQATDTAQVKLESGRVQAPAGELTVVHLHLLHVEVAGHDDGDTGAEFLLQAAHCGADARGAAEFGGYVDLPLCSGAR